MNRRLSPAPGSPGFTFDFNGESVAAAPGDTIASALLAAGIDIFSRSLKYHRPRGAWCLAGRCSHCLVRVDGVPDVVACSTPAVEGMSVTVQNAFPSVKHDVLAAIDWLFPKGLDHHAMFVGVPLAEGAVTKVARHIAGLGPLPETVPGPAEPCERRRCAVAIVGAGPAGLACAHALRQRGVAVELFDERPRLGGRLHDGLDPEADAQLAWAAQAEAECSAAGVRVNAAATVLGCYLEEGRRVLAVRRRAPDGLALVEAERIVFATGSVEPLEPFLGNDLPGIYAGRGLARLVRLQRVLPGSHAVVVGAGPESLALARLLATNGARVEAVVDPGGTLRGTEFALLSGFAPVRAEGRGAVRSLTVADAAGKEEHLACDLVAICGRPAPTFELARQAGAEVSYSDEAGGYRVVADELGRTAAPDIFVAGDIAGVGTAVRARHQGEALGRHLASTAP